jgi:antitoxin (DNA-binding transcriptional repressor) of toxin-antitoxin stability system
MSELSVREMRAGYHVITEALERDGEVVLTHHGKPFAKVVPIAPQVADEEVISAERRKKLKAWGAKQRRFLAGQKELPPFDWDEFRADRV